MHVCLRARGHRHDCGHRGPMFPEISVENAILCFGRALREPHTENECPLPSLQAGTWHTGVLRLKRSIYSFRARTRTGGRQGPRLLCKRRERHTGQPAAWTAPPPENPHTRGASERDCVCTQALCRLSCLRGGHGCLRTTPSTSIQL